MLLGDWENARVLRIRPKPKAGEQAVSIFAGMETEGLHIDPQSATHTQLTGLLSSARSPFPGYGICRGLLELKDGSILINDGVRILKVKADGTQVGTLIGTDVRIELHDDSFPGTYTNGKNIGPKRCHLGECVYRHFSKTFPGIHGSDRQ